MNPALTLLLASTALVVYVHVGHPLVLLAWARLCPRPFRRGEELPEVTVIVVAQDEGARICARLQNLLGCDYPQHLLYIVVASDGSTDDTVSRARMCVRLREEEQRRAQAPGSVDVRFVVDVPPRADATVRVIDWRIPRGKPACLNELVPAVRTPVVVLTDARQTFERGALRALVAPFADPKVGLVSGELLLDLRDDAHGTHGEAAANGVADGVGAYWRLEKLMRMSESTIDSTLGATGSICALRPEVFEPIPDDTLVDDMLIALRVVRRGLRTVFVPEARAHDVPSSDAAREFGRKARTLAGNFQLLARERWLWSPRQNRLWFTLMGHKVLRLLTPLFLFVCLAASVALLPTRLGLLAFEAQLVFYALAFVGHLSQGHKLPRVIAWPYVFCLLHAATVVGLLRLVRGRARVTWKRTRPASAID